MDGEENKADVRLGLQNGSLGRACCTGAEEAMELELAELGWCAIVKHVDQGCCAMEGGGAGASERARASGGSRKNI